MKACSTLEWGIRPVSPSKLRGKSPRISPESVFNSGFYMRRFGPNESRYIRRFENRDLGRLYGIRRENRLKRFHIGNDSEKGGTIPGRPRHKPLFPSQRNPLQRPRSLEIAEDNSLRKGSRRSGDWAGPADQPLTGELASAHARGTPLVGLVATRKHSKNSVT